MAASCLGAAGLASRCDDGDLFGAAADGGGGDFGLGGDDGGASLLDGSGELKAPGQFEAWDGDVRRLTSVATFKGAKVEVSKPLTPNFVLKHALQLGDSPAGGNSHYSFMAQVFNESGVIMSTLDQHGALEAQVIAPSLPAIDPRVSSKLILYFGSQNDMLWHDVECAGATCNTQLRWGLNVMGWQGLMAHFAYTQAVTPALSLGAEAGLQNGLTTPTGAATFKYDQPEDTWIGSVKTHAQPVASASEPGIGEASVQYHRKVVKDRVNLAASLTAVPQMGALQSAFGAEFALQQSTVSTAWVPSQGKLSTVVACKLNQGLNMNFSLEGAFGQQNPQTGEKADAFKFGYGLQIG